MTESEFFYSNTTDFKPLWTVEDLVYEPMGKNVIFNFSLD